MDFLISFCSSRLDPSRSLQARTIRPRIKEEETEEGEGKEREIAMLRSGIWFWFPVSCFMLQNRESEKVSEIAGWRRETEEDLFFSLPLVLSLFFFLSVGRTHAHATDTRHTPRAADGETEGQTLCAITSSSESVVFPSTTAATARRLHRAIPPQVPP